MKKKILPALAVALLPFAMTATAGTASPQFEPARAAVSFSDLDLDSASGRETLKRRVRSAAESVCPSANGVRGRAKRAGHDCIREATARAWSDIQAQQATARVDAAGNPRG